MPITLTQPRSSPRTAPRRSMQRLIYVDRVQFCELLVSRKKMVRSDSLDGKWRGLTDVESGTRYLIEENQL